MASSHKVKQRRDRVQILAVALIGAGLLVVGLVMLVVWTGGLDLAAPVNVGGPEPVQLNFPAPDLNLTQLNGEAVSLAETRGKYVLVNNWATWCPPCKAEMPVLEAFYQHHKNNGFTIVAVEAGDPPREVSAMVAQMGITFPVWLDPANAALSGFYNNALPSSYLVDPGGTVILGWSGAVTYQALEEHITPLLVGGNLLDL
jgi:cytochrome c biogenesis protein CcmG, thiol:disulfide interchange protein DsbE